MWDIILYSLLGLLALLLLLLLVPVFVTVTYRQELCVRVWVVGLPVYRYTAKEESPVKAASTAPPKESKPSAARDLVRRLKADGIGTVLSFIKKLTVLAAGTARRVLAAITVDKLYLRLTVTGEDAAQTAENTGRLCAVLYPAVTALQQTVLRLKRREITVVPDFLGETAQVEAKVTVHAVPLRLLVVAVWLFFRYLRIHKEVFEDGKQGAKSDGSVD